MRLSTPDPIADHPLVCAAIKRDVLADLAAKGLSPTAISPLELARLIVAAQRAYFGAKLSSERLAKRQLVADAIAAGLVPTRPTRQRIARLAIAIDLAAA